MRSVVQRKATYWVQRLKSWCQIITPAVVAVSTSLLINSAPVRPSTAQLTALPMPEYTLTDENNLDLFSFNFYLHQTDLSIGDSTTVTYTYDAAGNRTQVTNTGRAGSSGGTQTPQQRRKLAAVQTILSILLGNSGATS
jgi:hypothetical protein